MAFRFDHTEYFGDPIPVKGYEISPIKREIRLRHLRFPLRLSWVTPVAVSVRQGDGRVERVNIPDPTRRVQIGLALGVIGMGVMLYLSRRICRRR